MDLEAISRAGADFSGAELANADLSNATLRRISLRNSRLINVDFSHASFERVDLSGSEVSGSDFSGTTLKSAQLYELYVNDDFGRRTRLGPANLDSLYGFFQGSIFTVSRSLNTEEEFCKIMGLWRDVTEGNSLPSVLKDKIILIEKVILGRARGIVVNLKGLEPRPYELLKELIDSQYVEVMALPLAACVATKK